MQYNKTFFLIFIQSALELKSLRPDQIYLLRYEDLSLRPESEVRALLSFLGMALTNDVKRYVSWHTLFDIRGKHETARTSR